MLLTQFYRFADKDSARLPEIKGFLLSFTNPPADENHGHYFEGPVSLTFAGLIAVRMKNILIPTDFSKNARNAISYAMEFFKEQRCTFYFLHTYTPAFYRMDYILGGPGFSAIPDKGLDISQAGLEQTVADVKAQYGNPNHTFEMVSAFNILSDEINELTKRKDISLVVMGTQGATGAKEIFLGSNAVYVIRKSRIPVLVVPEGFAYRPAGRILFPTDYLSRYRDKDLQILIAFAKMQQATVTVLHVQEENPLSVLQQENRTMLDRSLQQLSHRMEELKGAYMPDAVIDFADRMEADMVVMMHRRHSFLQRLLLQQNIDQIGFHTKVPLLVIRDTSEI